MLRSFNIYITILVCLLLSVESGMAQQPNIVFIFADDLSYHDVATYGNDEVRTPNIDALADEGIQFNRAYNMGSWSPAVCVPSRTMLNTGKYVWNARRTSEDDYMSEFKQKDFWSQRIKQAGYSTYFTGKWHIPGLDPDELFDHVVHVRPGMPEQTEAGYNRPHKGKEDPWSPYDPEFGGFWDGGTHWSEVLADDALNFIDHASERDDPFFMYLAFNAAHDPRQSPRSYVESYDPTELKIPPNYQQEYPYNEAIGSGRDLRDERLAPFPRTKYAVGVQRQEYYAIISHMDEQIGIILDKLEESGKIQNTIIIFTADHGLAVGQHGLMGKQNMYEHSLRVPFIMTGPGIPQGEKNQTPIYLQDVTPTTIELAGGEVPDSYQFQSLLPLIRGDSTQHYSAIYGTYLDKQRSVIEWPYKLILYTNIEKVRLYNLEEDPYETEDLADEEDLKPVIQDLMERLVELQDKTGDQLDLNEYFVRWF